MNIEDKIFNYYLKFGSKDYIGEPVTQIEHMVQAAMLAEKNNEDIEVILASLFHDIGHLVAFDRETMGNFGIKKHEKLGADFLRSLGITGKIPSLVENHVSAKRYLSRNEEYYNKLSYASKQTLKYQGGPFNDLEANKYENDPNFKDYINIRLYDDQAKIINFPIKSLEYFKNMLRQYLNNKLVNPKN